MREGKRFKEATWWPQYLEAKPLELFVNLEESEAAFRAAHPKFKNEKNLPVMAAEFRKTYPDFAPEGWWSYRCSSLPDWPGVPKQVPELHWRMNQSLLRSAWDGGFRLEFRDLSLLLLSVFDPQNLGKDDAPVLADPMEIDESPYYKSVLWLNSQPWRAKTCKSCWRRFVASWPSNEWCSQHCIPTAQPSYKRDYRNDRRDKYNANRKKARAKAKLKRTQCRAK
jgi:hypothetical protein